MEFGSWDTIKRLLGDAKIDNKAVDGLTGTPDSLSYITQAIQEISGAAVIGRAVTAVLCVSPNGSGTDGASWTTAYQTIQAALNAASTDANECTLILVGINTGPTNFYDIDTTGDPTWTGNYIIMGTHRTWAKIKNNHTSATSVMKFTGYTSLIDLNINLGASNNGVIITKGAFRLSRVQLVGEDLTSAKTALHIDGATTLKHGKVTGLDFLGEGKTQMTAMKLDNVARSRFCEIRIHDCKTGIHITEAGSDSNVFCDSDIGDCGTGIDIDAGNVQHFKAIVFHGNDTNVDDEVGDHVLEDMYGHFPITIEPDDFTGVTLNASATGDTWTKEKLIRTATAATKPFRVVAVHSEADATEKFRMRFSTDAGLTHYDDIQVEGDTNAIKREGSAFPSGTEFIFNKSTRITGSCKSESGGNGAVVWLELQEI